MRRTNSFPLPTTGLIAVLALTSVMVAAAEETAAGAVPGSVVVILAGAEKDWTVVLVDRSPPKKPVSRKTLEYVIPLQPVKTGTEKDASRWMARGVPPGQYDLRIKSTAGAWTLEGVPAGPPAGIAPRTFRCLSPVQAAAIKDKIKRMKSFYDERHIWAMLEGESPETAHVLMELVRNGNMTYKKIKDPVNWRVEVWTYKLEFGTWKRTDALVIDRKLLPRSEYKKLNRLFAPELGRLAVPAGGTLQLKFDAAGLLSRAASRRGGISTSWTEPVVPRVSGRVILVDTETGMIVVNIGSRQGAARGGKLVFDLPDGNTLEGTIRSVMADQSTVYVENTGGIELDTPARLKLSLPANSAGDKLHD